MFVKGEDQIRATYDGIAAVSNSLNAFQVRGLKDIDDAIDSEEGEYEFY